MPRNTTRRPSRGRSTQRTPFLQQIQSFFGDLFATPRRRGVFFGTLGAVALVLAVLLIALPGAQNSPPTDVPPQPAKTADLPPALSATRNPRTDGQAGDTVLPTPVAYRYIGNGAQDFSFSEKQIDQPSVYDKELAFSAGTGNISSAVLTGLYYFNIDTGEETKLATASIYKGEYYETLINHDWVVYLETDHGKNNIIHCLNRATSEVVRIKNCTNGKPKLRMAGDTLIWMEQEADKVDQLYMIDLRTQEDALLFSLQGASSYGVSSPYIYDRTIVWAGPEQDEAGNEVQSQNSFIYWVPIGSETFSSDGTMNYNTVRTGTYVHEPKYNGTHFIWIDTNKSPTSNLYLCDKEGKNITVVARGVTTYNIGDDVVVYGKDQGVWAYIISTGETCRLTTEGEKAQMPVVNKRTVVWYNLSGTGDSDVLRYKVLTDADLYPGK